MRQMINDNYYAVDVVNDDADDDDDNSVGDYEDCIVDDDND